MKLLRLDIHGFKSFAEPSTLIFSTPGSGAPAPITAIVGPNGSGKSNIVDAIKWVLGEQSMKSIRSKKSDDIIFAGSRKRTQRGTADVMVTLCNHDNQVKKIKKQSSEELTRLLEEASEITIGRRHDRNGNSNYSLCGKHVRLSDIHLFLAQANFGQGTYSIIGQGAIDSLLTSKPQELRELFEEASGVKIYRLKREQALAKLISAKENLHESEIRLQSLHPRKNSLERQVKRFKKRKEIEANLREARECYYAGRLKILSCEFDKIDARAAQAEKEKSDCLFRHEKTKKIFECFGKEDEPQKTSLEEKLSELLKKQQNLHRTALDIARGNRIIIEKPKTSSWKERIKQIILGWRKIRAKLSEVGATDSVRNELDKLFHELESVADEKQIPKVQAEPSVSGEEQKNLDDLKSVEGEIVKIQNEIQKRAETRQEERRAVFAAQLELQKAQNNLREVEQKLNQIQIERARLEAHEEDLENEIRNTLNLREPKIELKDAKAAGPDEFDALFSEIQRLARSADLAGSIDPQIEEEYEQVKQETDFLERQTEDLLTASQKTEAIILDLEKHIKQQFDESFRTINESFEETFKILFNGGTARLEETPKTEESEGGIEIIAQPPGKRIKHLSMLSGGERSLAGIALICAIIFHNTPPFVVLDEVDAALDEANTHRLVDILKRLSQKTQFLLITHNRVSMEVADLLYGVTMGEDGVSNLLSLRLADAEKSINS